MAYLQKYYNLRSITLKQRLSVANVIKKTMVLVLDIGCLKGVTINKFYMETMFLTNP